MVDRTFFFFQNHFFFQKIKLIFEKPDKNPLKKSGDPWGFTPGGYTHLKIIKQLSKSSKNLTKRIFFSMTLNFFKNEKFFKSKKWTFLVKFCEFFIIF